MILTFISFNQRTQYGVLQVFNWLLCGLRLPSTNAPSMGCFARRKKDSFFLRDLQPTHPVLGASSSSRYAAYLSMPSTNAPSMGCFDIHITARPRHNTFNQRTLYGVLPIPLTTTYRMSTFNQRTQYGELPFEGFLTLTVVRTFNQRTQYGVLPW